MNTNDLNQTTNDESSSDLSLYYDNDDRSSDISYEEEIRTDLDEGNNVKAMPTLIHGGIPPSLTMEDGGGGGSGYHQQMQGQSTNGSLNNNNSNHTSNGTIPNHENGNESNHQNNDREKQILQLQQQQQQQQEKEREEKEIQQRIKLNHLEDKRNQLVKKLNEVKSKRCQVQEETNKINQRLESKIYEYNEISSRRKQALERYASIQKKLTHVKSEKERLDSMHVLHDVFYIYHRGYFATINGLRLGMSEPVKHAASTNGSSAHTSNTLGPNSPSTSNDLHVQNDVPWHEINAGIGMAALLISTIQAKLQIRSKFTILPRGSTTKVCFNVSAHHDKNGSGLESGSMINSQLINDVSNNQEWDLHFQPTTFSFFTKRYWNVALNILGYCLYEIVGETKRRLVILQSNHRNAYNSTSNNEKGSNHGKKSEMRDPNNQIEIPYSVELSGDWKSDRSTGYVKIGGLDIGFDGDGIAWTRALRYVAIDLKWIIAFIAKYVDL